MCVNSQFINLLFKQISFKQCIGYDIDDIVINLIMATITLQSTGLCYLWYLLLFSSDIYNEDDIYLFIYLKINLF